MIEKADGELVDEIALVHRVNLHAVKPGALGIVGALAEALNNGVNLIHGQGTAGLVQPAVGDRRGRDRRKLAEICRNRDAAEAAGHLQKDLAAVGVDAFGHLPACPDKMHGVVCAVRAVGHGLHFHRAVGKRDAVMIRPVPAFGALGVVINAALVKAALRVRQSERPIGAMANRFFICTLPILIGVKSSGYFIVPSCVVFENARKVNVFTLLI